MRHRLTAAAVLVLGVAALGPAQTPTYSKAVPPDKAALDRLNLKTEWTVYIPVEGGRDTITSFQTLPGPTPALPEQVYIQTKTGMVYAIDGPTGRLQWSVQLGNGGFTNTYPVAVNSSFVFVVNETRVFAFARYSGVAEFTLDLGITTLKETGSLPVGVTADDAGFYVLLMTGVTGGQRVEAFNLPRPLAVVLAEQAGKNPTPVGNPVDDIAKRYPGGAGVGRPGSDVVFEDRRPLRIGTTGGEAGNRTPSLAAVTSVTPPYSSDIGNRTPSLSSVSSLRQPYHLMGDFQKDFQRTPSLSTIPPSVAAQMQLTDLRPQAVRPPLRWQFATPNRILFTPILTPYRIWGAGSARGILGLGKVDKRVDVKATTPAEVTAAPGQAGTTGYFPLADGSMISVDLAGGTIDAGMKINWRANVGGTGTHVPFVTADAVYASGDRTGVVRVDRASGEVTWQSEAFTDRVVAANQEFVYLRDIYGQLLIYDARRATDPAGKKAAALTGIKLPEFNVPTTNTVSDRVYLAADNGLVVCLRDASPKYARPIRICPEILVNPPPAPKLDEKKDGMPPVVSPKP